MVDDVLTVMWKETKLLQQGSGRGRLWPIIFVLVFGLILPAQAGPAFIQMPIGIAFWMMIPPMLISTWAADSFAGERERHTMETLLASRLSDRAILFGKIAVLAGFSWAMALVAMVLSLAGVNAAHWQGEVILYSPTTALAGVLLALLTATISTNLGVLVSLRASTVRQAQQALGLGIFVMAWIPIVGLNLLPTEWKEALREFGGIVLGSGDLLPLALGLGIVLFLIDVALLGAALARFQRSRLILD
jgi:ABC-2 type transport system permease protein